MKTFVLNGAEVANREELHCRLAEGLGFPAWYGGNLDALYDCLTDCTGKVRILNWEIAEERLGNYGTKSKKVIAAAAVHNTALDLYI